MTEIFARFHKLIQLTLDFTAVSVAWWFAYWFRFSYIKGAQLGLSSVFLTWYVPLVILSIYYLRQNEPHEQRTIRPVSSDLMEVLRANTLSAITFIVLLYFLSESRISRLTIVIYLGLSTLLLIISRLLMRSSIRKLRRRGYLLSKVLLIGDSEELCDYSSSISYMPRTGLIVMDWLGRDGAKSLSLDETGALNRLLSQTPPDLVVLGFKEEKAAFVSDFIERYYDRLFEIQILSPTKRSLLGLSLEDVNGIQVMSLNKPHFSLLEVGAKRFLDLLMSGCGLVALALPFAVIALLVRLSSPGPVFFGQVRIGINGTKFKMWKFRTMKQAKNASESHGWTVANDPRRTKFGTFLRTTSLDELPQLWNVFVGEMSLVGPRPEQPHFVEKFRHEIPAYMLRHKMKAGITGWAQVSGWRGDTSLHKRIEYDLYYIRNWSMWFDVKIFVLTFVRGFINKNAY